MTKHNYDCLLLVTITEEPMLSGDLHTNCSTLKELIDSLGNETFKIRAVWYGEIIDTFK